MDLPAEKEMESCPRPLSGKFILKASIICISFANLCFMSTWNELFDRHSDFFKRYSISLRQLAAVTLDVLLLALVLWISVCLVAKSGNHTWNRILKWGALVGLLLPFDVLRFSTEARAVLALVARQAGPVRILLEVLGFAAGIILLWNWERLSIPVSSRILVIFSPLLPLLVATAAWGIYNGPPAGRLPDKPPVGALPQKAGAPHVLWFIFDEWDQALTFEHRPANLQLPELDRFRGQSFHADRAYPPGDYTLWSIPSLLTGKVFLGADGNGGNELLMTYDRNQPQKPLRAESTVFAEARNGGFNVGIVGFYLPYCRVFDTTSCEWYPMQTNMPVEWVHPVSLGRSMMLAARRLVSRLPLAKRLGVRRALGEDPFSYSPSLSAATYRQVHKAALHSIDDSRLNLVFIHWNIPHPPAIYDAAKDDFSSDRANSYLDNLKLLDRTVRDIRVTLEEADMWDASTILMTSDHPLRFGLWRANYPDCVASLAKYTQTSEVPFLLKMAGQKQGLAYDAPIQTVVTKDLLLAIMKGEISQPEQVGDWLDRHPPHQ